MSEGKQVLWIVGYPSAGKTFMGDYLATRGYFHIDGDQGNQMGGAINDKLKLLWQGMQDVMQGKPVDDAMWQPYFQALIDQANHASKKHDKVVMSFAILGTFDKECEFIEKQIPNVKFIHVHVER